MGLFNTLTLDASIVLPGLTDKITSWQTKDLVDILGPFADLYIDADKHLKVNIPEEVWVDDPGMLLGGWLKTLSKATSTLTQYTGRIKFYQSYTHPDYSLHSDHNFVYGWYEYKAKIVDGAVVGDIECIERTLPRKLSLEESAAARQKSKDNRAIFEKEQQTTRKNKPSTTQQLIDTIDTLANRPKDFVMPEMSDYDAVLKEISESIKNYRTKYDPWYTE